MHGRFPSNIVLVTFSCVCLTGAIQDSVAPPKVQMFYSTYIAQVPGIHFVLNSLIRYTPNFYKIVNEKYEKKKPNTE